MTVAPKFHRILWIALVLFMSGYETVRAQDPTHLKQILEVIADHADRICASIPLGGSRTELQLSGEAKAELDNFLARIAKLGIKGSAAFTSQDYKGVLQDDLVRALQHSTDCKRDISDKLRDAVLFKSEPSPRKTRSVSRGANAQKTHATIREVTMPRKLPAKQKIATRDITPTRARSNSCEARFPYARSRIPEGGKVPYGQVVMVRGVCGPGKMMRIVGGSNRRMSTGERIPGGAPRNSQCIRC